MKCTLMQHQKNAVAFAVKNDGVCAFFHEVGCGKTISALATFEEFRINNPTLRLLVICPISLIHGAWTKEIEKFTDFNWCDLHGKKSMNHKNPMPYGYCYTPDIYLINFESLIVPKRFDALMALLASGDFMVAVDESSKMKNHAAATTEHLIGWWEKDKVLKRNVFRQGVKHLCKYRLLMSGTPAPNIEWEYWAQMNFLDPQILGPNFHQFRNTYFALQRGKDEVVRGAIFNKAVLKDMFENGYKYEFDEQKRTQFFDRMSGWVNLVKAKDCLDLPESVDEYREVVMDGEQARIYKEMKNDYIAEIKKELTMVPDTNVGNVPGVGESIAAVPSDSSMVVANLILTKILKLRQITSGFAIDEDGEAREINPKKNAKIDALLDIIEECAGRQIIVWGQFRWEIRKIVEELSKIAGVSELHGGIKQEHRIDHVNKFLSGENRFLVAHPDSAAHGLTFVNANVEVFFSFSYSYEEYSQARGRIMRHGQKNNCVYFHIVAQNSVDAEILAVCQKKQNKQDVAERFLKDVNQ